MTDTVPNIPNSEAMLAPRPLVPLSRNRDFLLLWGGQAVSVLGDGVAELAYPLLVFALTRSPLDTGLLGALQVAAFVIFSLPGGVLVDRLDRKRTMILCDAARGMLFLGIVLAALLGHLSLTQVYVSGFLEGALYVVFGLCETSALPQVVDRSQVGAALGQTQAASGAAGIVSQALAGALFGISQALPFLLDALSFVASVGSLLLIRTPFQRPRPAERHGSLRAEITLGLRWLLRHPVLGPVTLLNGVNNLTASAFTVVVIVVAARQGIPTPVLGLVFSAVAVGSLLGSLLGGRVQPYVRLGVALPSCLITSACCWLLMIVWSGPLALAIAGFGVGAAGPLYTIPIISYRLSEVPDDIQGRVTSATRLLNGLWQPLGLLLMGAVLQTLGPTVAVLLAAGSKVVVGGILSALPALRALPAAAAAASAAR